MQTPHPGRFLLTGSARVLGLRSLPDTLVGRMETVELWPFSQSEIDHAPDGFVDAVFTQDDLGALPAYGGLRHSSTVSRAEYAERLVRGGFPGAIARTNDRRRRSFFNSYVGDLIARDVAQLSEIERTTEMRALIQMLAARSGQLLSFATLSNELGLGATTVKNMSHCSKKSFSSSGCRHGPETLVAEQPQLPNSRSSTPVSQHTRSVRTLVVSCGLPASSGRSSRDSS